MGFNECVNLKSSKQGGHITIFLFNDYVLLARKVIENNGAKSKSKKKDGILERRNALYTHELIVGAPVPIVKLIKGMKGDFIELLINLNEPNKIILGNQISMSDLNGIFRMIPRKTEKLSKFLSIFQTVQSQAVLRGIYQSFQNMHNNFERFSRKSLPFE